MPLLVKDYRYWSVSVHENQGYLGRLVVWCKREDALDLTDATETELLELAQILRELRVALTTAFQADWMNYAFLGNGTRHLHAHVIPRYASKRTFADITFTDERWGHNYKTDHTFVTSPEVLEAVRTKLSETLSSI